MMNNTRIAFVPIDEIGMEKCNYMEYDSQHVMAFEISEDEFQALVNGNVLNVINSKADLLIDDYEEERIPSDALPLCNSIIHERGVFDQSSFAKAIKTGIKYGTFVDLCF